MGKGARLRNPHHHKHKVGILVDSWIDEWLYPYPDNAQVIRPDPVDHELIDKMTRPAAHHLMDSLGEEYMPPKTTSIHGVPKQTHYEILVNQDLDTRINALEYQVRKLTKLVQLFAKSIDAELYEELKAKQISVMD